MQEVNFTVKNIKAGAKEEFVDATVILENGKEVEIARKSGYDKNEGFNYIVFSGCKIFFDPSENYGLASIKRIYDVKGITKTTTEGFVKNIETPVYVAPEATAVKIEKESKAVKHAKYNEIKVCLQNNIPIYLAGPAGSGKNFTVEQIANELGWDFFTTGSVQQEYKLTGFIDAGGKFHDTEFFKACSSENECVFFLDEMDASIPEVLVLLNAAIANGYFEFPTGRVNFDKVHFVAAGNTVGSGADESYTGRMVLDQATLDRFAIIEFGYDKKIELSLCGGNEELVNFIHDLRAKAESQGIRTTFSYRCITMVTKLEKAGMALETIIKIAVVKGLDKDTISNLTLNGNNSKYAIALKKVA